MLLYSLEVPNVPNILTLIVTLFLFSYCPFLNENFPAV